MVNINKLKGKIVENELSIEKLAEKMGIDRSTLYRRFDSKGEDFTIKETGQICEILNLTEKEIAEIFFSQTVA
jgi:DNA-binding Xre family transcriptional regulator